MRLSKIRLSGFKSFVDPTSIQFPSNLMAIVGPNGCGKSNVIDAVRWVMGESSAKHLRGDSMADVIFNGSRSRKPVGVASIELVFDNSDGTIGGQFAGFSEISVKRAVTRDGISVYSLNNTRCRRKDITSIFLGTGLGPRSYAIIEQGMISRLIEAKPEEMRVYLEEAAGISKYKDRRHETEIRIRHTRENLDRLNDLRDEIEKHISHLRRQARTAERYRVMKERERRMGAELLALRLADLEELETNHESRVSERDTALQAAIAKQRDLETRIEKTRQEHAARTDALNEVQGRFYKIGAEIARLEQAIQHARELRQRQQRDLEQTEQGLKEICGHIEKDEAQIKGLSSSLGELEPEFETARAVERASVEALRSAERDMQSWQKRWEEYTTQAGETTRAAEVEKTRIEGLETGGQRLLSRRERCAADIAQISGRLEDPVIDKLAVEESTAAKAVTELQQELDGVNADVVSLREMDREKAATLDEFRGQLQKALGHLASLDALQQAALGQQLGSISEWLESHGMKDSPRLAQQITAAKGWERAVETVLGNYLEAICVDGLTDVAKTLNSLTHGTVSFLESNRVTDLPGNTAAASLLSKFEGPETVTTLVAKVLAVDGLDEALSIRGNLGDGESVVTKDGIWIGQSWLRVNRETDEKAGVISREQDIRQQRKSVKSLEKNVSELSEHHDRIRQDLEKLENTRDDLQSRLNETHQKQGDVRGKLNTARARVEETRNRLDQLKSEASEIDTHMDEAEGLLRKSRARLEQSTGQMSVFEAQRKELETQRKTLGSSLDETRTQARLDQEKAQDIAIRMESRKSTRDSAAIALERLRAQVAQFSSRRQDLTEQLESDESPMGGNQENLNALLDSRVGVESNLGQARDSVQTAENKLRELQEKRQSSEQTTDQVRQALDELRLAAREVSVRRQTIAEQFQETRFDLDELKREMDAEASLDRWQEELEKLAASIQRLGAINLASIEELKEQEERKEYLDSQFADLTEALETLENAIKKIDRETRTRFKETFDKVNDGLKEIFPRLFGGGHGYLELGGDDLLNAGVTVMARPPGKRISTIHLMSGGEKALTAVALVFSIFELNPAPFCMLDEVDAPLDDANVARFCEIVREMSERVQFIIITHNKMTMEMTHQLAGVTMHEPGVSRLVAVDLDEAVEMAAM
jgi:chromosome segregation protein